MKKSDKDAIRKYEAALLKEGGIYKDIAGFGVRVLVRYEGWKGFFGKTFAQRPRELACVLAGMAKSINLECDKAEALIEAEKAETVARKKKSRK